MKKYRSGEFEEKRYFQMPALGKKALEHSWQAKEELWKAMPKISLDLKIMVA
ncbi:MAG TPA: hypothetical protein VK658_10160 [Chryseolinea sp.]|nr:hypothetical protein [Chryseolinea sp.]